MLACNPKVDVLPCFPKSNARFCGWCTNSVLCKAADFICEQMVLARRRAEAAWLHVEREIAKSVAYSMQDTLRDMPRFTP